MELQYANSAMIPTLIVHPSGLPVSRMILAEPFTGLAPLCFDSLRSLRAQFKERLREICIATIEAYSRRRQLISGGWPLQFRRILVRSACAVSFRGPDSRASAASAPLF